MSIFRSLKSQKTIGFVERPKSVVFLGRYGIIGREYCKQNNNRHQEAYKLGLSVDSTARCSRISNTFMISIISEYGLFDFCPRYTWRQTHL